MALYTLYVLFYLEEQQLILLCKTGDRQAQRLLYDRYSPRLFGVCRRYVRNDADAEEILLSGMYKVLLNVEKYEPKGSFDGWMYRIVVNECLMFLRKQHVDFQRYLEIETQYDLADPRASSDADLHESDILQLLDRLPLGYRTVFNLYVLEGYTHREIADMLGVSINTSKSQLIKARRMLQQWLEKMGYAIALPSDEE